MGHKESTAWLALALVAATGMAAVLMATRQGPGVSPDSVSYIAAARNLLEGRGFVHEDGPGHFVPITNWPPLYSVALALPGLVGVDPLPGARAVDAVLFVLTLLLVGRAVYRRSGRSLVPALFAMLALGSVCTMLRIHVMAWSESLFVSLTVFGLLALAHHLERPSWGWLTVASLAAGAAFITRYPGIALVAAGSLGLLLWRKGNRWQRLRDGVAFGAVACLPLFLWMTRNMSTAGTATSRHLVPRLVDAPHLLEGLETLRAWLVPTTLAHGMKWVVMAALVAGAVTYVLLLVRNRAVAADQRPPPARPGRLLPLLLLFAAMYVGALIGAMAFANPSCDLSERYLVPILPALVVVLTCGVYDQLRAGGRARAARAVFGVLCVVYVLANLLQTVPWAREAGDSGVGFLSRSWRRSPIIARLAELPLGVPVYSNRGEAIYILTGKSTYSLPLSDGSERARRELGAVRKGLREDGGVVAYFTRVDRPYLLSQEQLETALPLRPVLQARDGALYQWGAPSAP
jgi:hypothetical protein